MPIIISARKLLDCPIASNKTGEESNPNYIKSGPGIYLPNKVPGFQDKNPYSFPRFHRIDEAKYKLPSWSPNHPTIKISSDKVRLNY